MRPGHQAMRVTASLALGTGGKLNVIEFQGRELLIAVSRNGISLIATGLDGDFDV
jgi:flagellar biogenesis protein FliO